jgi:hypothetical protein
MDTGIEDFRTGLNEDRSFKIGNGGNSIQILLSNAVWLVTSQWTESELGEDGIRGHSSRQFNIQK